MLFFKINVKDSFRNCLILSSESNFRDVRDPKFLKERASSKVAKEQFEQFQRIEQEAQHLFSGNMLDQFNYRSLLRLFLALESPICMYAVFALQ